MAMSKRKFSTILAETSIKLNIPRENMIISMGGASLIFGLREATNDIDILMIDTWDRQIFNRLVAEGHSVKRYPQTGIMIGADIIAVGDVDLHWYDEDDLSYQHRNYRGYRICTEYQLLVDRIKLGREKDLAEMLLFKEHYSKLPQYLKDRYNQLIKQK